MADRVFTECKQATCNTVSRGETTLEKAPWHKLEQLLVFETVEIVVIYKRNNCYLAAF